MKGNYAKQLAPDYTRMSVLEKTGKKTKGEREIGKLWLGNYPNLNENNEL